MSANPVDFTPHVLDGTVWALALVGDTVVVGGSFTKVTDSSRRQTYARKNVFAYGLNDGAIRSFAPAVDGAVYALAAGAEQHGLPGRRVQDRERRRPSAAWPASRSPTAARISTLRRPDQLGRRPGTRASAAASLYAGGTFSAINGVRAGRRWPG